jgi:threonyl-tRNA synthetase
MPQDGKHKSPLRARRWRWTHLACAIAATTPQARRKENYALPHVLTICTWAVTSRSHKTRNRAFRGRQTDEDANMAQISLTFPDGISRDFDAGVTAAAVAENISKSLAKKAISATVNGQHWDLAWPIVQDAQIAIHTMADEEQANELVRHDLAHIMARAVQVIWPDTKVTIGPVIKDGWYYDFDRAEPFTPEDLGVIEKKMREIINKRDPVRTEVWDRDVAIQYYTDRNEPYKVELIEAIPGDEPLRMYWHGDWQDLCRGPHLQHTGQVPGDSFKLMSIAGAYWRGDSNRAMLQRIYGVAFTGKEKLRAHLNMLEEAAKRDHRKLGREMDLFHMQEEAPGQIFWHPNGWTIYTELQDYMRRKQRAGGYQEINTPQVVDRKLWEASGHWDKYQEHMFVVEVEEEHAKEKAINALKPMNCPCHVQVFNQGLKSYRDLPLRLAEFGSCARYEPSGALHGIMRVRGFTQDDAHIFCTEDQIEAECAKFITFLADIYADLGFEQFEIKFATRPENRVGSDESWDHVEGALEAAIKATGRDFTLEPGDGAFYGPKLDFYLTDAIGRVWQCGTFQVDPNLPERLGATYIAPDGSKQRPYMLHRACLGSFERFIGILIEEHAGKLPFWLAPRQVVVASIISDADDYVNEVAAALRAAGVRAEADTRNEKINYKVREHSVGKVPVILAVGAREVEDRTLSVRRLGEKQSTVQGLDEVVTALGTEATPPDLR